MLSRKSVYWYLHFNRPIKYLQCRTILLRTFKSIREPNSMSYKVNSFVMLKSLNSQSLILNQKFYTMIHKNQVFYNLIIRYYQKKLHIGLAFIFILYNNLFVATYESKILYHNSFTLFATPDLCGKRKY